MNRQKDIRQTNIESHGHGNVSNVSSLVNKSIFEYVAKKTEKIVTALYMVTDFMGADDAIKSRVRLLGVNLLSDTFGLTSISLVESQARISSTLAQIAEILSLINIARNMGYISEMNANILQKELGLLSSELEPNRSESIPLSISLSANMFEVDMPKRQENILGNGSFNRQLPHLKDKRTSYDMSFRSAGVSFTGNNDYKIGKTASSQIHTMSKNERVQKIIGIIKDKGEVSIKDISATFKDYSEKTIQRELNSLVSKGEIKKTGEKRWSRYQLA